MDIKRLFEQIEADGQVTEDEIKMLNAALLEDGKLDFEERSLIERLHRKIKSGEIKEIRS